MIDKDHKHQIWVIGLVFIIGIICMTLIYLNSHPYAIRFEMDNNTLEAVKSINYTALSQHQANAGGNIYGYTSKQYYTNQTICFNTTYLPSYWQQI